MWPNIKSIKKTAFYNFISNLALPLWAPSLSARPVALWPRAPRTPPASRWGSCCPHWAASPGPTARSPRAVTSSLRRSVCADLNGKRKDSSEPNPLALLLSVSGGELASRSRLQPGATPPFALVGCSFLTDLAWCVYVSSEKNKNNVDGTDSFWFCYFYL